MNFIQKYKKAVVFSILMVIILCMAKLTSWYNSLHYKEILQSPAFSRGYFTGEVEMGGKGSNGSQYKCVYVVGNTNFSSYQPGFRCEPFGKILFEHSFPVIYNTIEPSKGQVLVFPDDFSRFNLPFPDSLRWVLKYDR